MSYKYLQQIESEYKLSGPPDLNLIHDGLDNKVFIVTDKNGSKFVLRESKRDNKNSSFEIEVLEALAKADFSSPRILKTRDVKYSIVFNNTEITLFEYIKGSQIEKLELNHLDDDVIERGAKKLGELHSLTNGMIINATPNRTIFTEYDRLLKIDNNLLKQFKSVDVFIRQVEDFYEKASLIINKKKELFGVIHNDYRIQNLIFADKNCFVIDFDWSCCGPLLKDLGLAVAEWSMYGQKIGPSKEVIKKFIKAYNETAPQSAKYDSDLIFWICFACLSDVCTFFADVIEGKYPENNITDVQQCYMYKKFEYFYQNLK
ncbi:MAG: phosphotransferase [bacterium]|nr:phosphotransferase [bacterium]